MASARTKPPRSRSSAPPRSKGVPVNDQQSQLNETRVARIEQPESVAGVQAVLAAAARESLAVSIAGGRHAMGGQQFGRGTILVDLTALKRVLTLDRRKGRVTAEAGIMWPELIECLHALQPGVAQPWTIREKQTGVDRVTLGGSLSANVHGRGLKNPPIIADVESFDLVDASGGLVTCSRRKNRELFSLAIGGYGLFGVIVRVTLCLVRRFKVRREVEIIAVRDLLPKIKARMAEGYLFGDCQYSPHLDDSGQPHPGVFSCYRPVPISSPVTPARVELSAEDWARLYSLVRTDKPRAFAVYRDHYLSTQGQVYWSDTDQLAGAFSGHRDAVIAERGTEMISEVYLPWSQFLPFMIQAKRDFLRHRVDVSYGTIRFIERDRESFLPWARKRFVCIVCNLHVIHTPAGVAKARRDFRRLFDLALAHGGSFYLTYHRWATRGQLLAAHPRLPEFLRRKRKWDPEERFQSDWYRHLKRLLALDLARAPGGTR